MLGNKTAEATDKETRAVFDDFTEQPNDEGYDTDTWTQVCEGCANVLRLPYSGLAIGEGNGICGSKGCDKESDHYYDFNRI